MTFTQHAIILDQRIEHLKTHCHQAKVNYDELSDLCHETDPLDKSSHATEFNTANAILINITAQLLLAEDTKNRIKQDPELFDGHCIFCDAPIPLKRLELYPEKLLCATCSDLDAAGKMK